MTRRDFSILLKKYQNGHATEKETELVEYWYSLLDVETKEIADKDWQNFENKIWLKIHKKLFKQELPEKATVWSSGILKVGMAAAILLVGVLVFFNYQNRKRTADSLPMAHSDHQKLVEKVNLGTKSQLLTLEDGTQVSLEPSGRIRFPKQFLKDKREVYLEGTAFFQVSENAKRPFLVYANKIVTRVLGTSFKITAPQNTKNIEVAVKTGKVAVYELKYVNSKISDIKGNGVILKPNHKVVYLDDNKTFVTGIVEHPSIQLEKKNIGAPVFIFEDTPLSLVLQKIEKAYGIDIEVENSLINDCPLTANLTDHSLFSQLDIICAVINGSYEIKGTTILVSGKGCE